MLLALFAIYAQALSLFVAYAAPAVATEQYGIICHDPAGQSSPADNHAQEPDCCTLACCGSMLAIALPPPTYRLAGAARRAVSVKWYGRVDRLASLPATQSFRARAPPSSLTA